MTQTTTATLRASGGQIDATRQLWAGRILSGIAVAFLLFDALGKLIKVQPVIEGTAQLGYPESSIIPIGVLLLILATHVLFPVYVAFFVWGGLALRSPRLMAVLKEGQ